jgi:hypothetical protein
MQDGQRCGDPHDSAMGEHVTVEVADQSSQWVPVGSVSEVEPPASFTSETGDGSRVLYVAGWVNNDGPGVWRSASGFDHANDVVREVVTTELQLVHDLRECPAELSLHRPSELDTIRIRLEFKPGDRRE